jgi:hypothetical protein
MILHMRGLGGGDAEGWGAREREREVLNIFKVCAGRGL